MLCVERCVPVLRPSFLGTTWCSSAWLYYNIVGSNATRKPVPHPGACRPEVQSARARENGTSFVLVLLVFLGLLVLFVLLVFALVLVLFLLAMLLQDSQGFVHTSDSAPLYASNTPSQCSACVSSARLPTLRLADCRCRAGATRYISRNLPGKPNSSTSENQQYISPPGRPGAAGSDAPLAIHAGCTAPRPRPIGGGGGSCCCAAAPCTPFAAAETCMETFFSCAGV